VLDQIQQMGRDPAVLHEVLAQVRQEDDARLTELAFERGGLERDLLRGQGELRKLLAQVASSESSGAVVSLLAQLQERVGQVEQRLARLRAQVEAIGQERLDEDEAARALAGLDPAWEAMAPDEQARVVQLLVSRVDYDGARSKVSITFHPLGLKTLAGELLGHSSEERSA
jgi:site-specific DNA recombinase